MTAPALATWDARIAAIQQAIVLASGFPASSVVWGFQNVNAPPTPYIMLSIGSMLTVGQDYVATSYNSARPAGQEIRLEVKGTREMMLNVYVFTDPVAGSASAMPFGSSSAPGMAEVTKSALLLPAVRKLFASVQVSPFDPGAVAYVPGIANTTFRARANLPIRCYVPAAVAVAYVGYFTTVSGNIVVEDPAGNIIRTQPFRAPE